MSRPPYFQLEMGDCVSELEDSQLVSMFCNSPPRQRSSRLVGGRSMIVFDGCGDFLKRGHVTLISSYSVLTSK